MKVFLNRFHKFLEDYDDRVEKHYGTRRADISHAEHLKNLKEWYDFDVIVDELGTEAYVEMTEQNFTMFGLKYIDEKFK